MSSTAPRASTLRVLVACAGGAAAASGADAQTAFAWNLMGDGDWTDTSAWTPMGSPGELTGLDTATLGDTGVGAYTVTYGASRSIAGIAFTSPLARVQMLGGTFLAVNGDVSGSGTLELNTGGSPFNAVVSLAPATTVSVGVVLNGPGTDDAQLLGSTDPALPAVLDATSVLSGTGTVDRYFTFDGLVLAGPGDVVRLVLDDATLAGTGTFRQDTGGDIQWNFHTVTGVTLAGDALGLRGGEGLTVGPGVTFDDPITLNTNGTTFNSQLFLADGVTLGAEVTLSGPANEDAQIFGPTGPGERATLDAATTVSGTGRFDGFLDIGAAVTADDGDVIRFQLDDGIITGGGTITERAGGDVQWNFQTATGVTLGGDALGLQGGESLIIGPGVVFADPITLNTNGTTFNSQLFLNDGVTLTADVVLNGPGNDDARISGPTAEGTRATVGGASTVSGTGRFLGFLDLAGAVTVPEGGAVRFAMNDGLITGGGTLTQIGDFVWSGHTATGITLAGDLVVDPGETLNIGDNVTVLDPIAVNDAGSTFNAVLNILDGVEFGDEIVLAAPTTDDARLVGPTTAGERATLGAGSLVTGTGIIDGFFDLGGTVRVAENEAIRLSINDGVVTGGGVLDQDGGDFQWNGQTVVGMTLRGDHDLDISEGLTIGQGVVFEEPFTISNGMSTFNTVLNVLDGVDLDADIVLNGLGLDDAELRGPTTEGESATIAAGASLAGRGRLNGRFGAFDGTLAPGLLDTDLDTIQLRHDAPMTFGPSAITEIGYAGDGPGEFDVIDNTGEIVLGGALVVDALGGFEPMSENAIVFITGGTISGAYDSVTYNGNLSPGDVARVFYDDSSVTFAVTCNADVELPAGTIDILDVLTFLNLWNGGDLAADFDLSGELNILDVLLFLNVWNTGCP